MKIITFASWKGGTGKTSLATAAIETFAKEENKILIIDLDSNLSISSIYDCIGAVYTSVELLNNNSNFHPCYSKARPKSEVVEKINIIPSDLKISRLNNISDRVLKVNLSKINLSNYDYVFVDPPGTMNALTRNAMIAADKIIIPAMISDIDFQATKLILEEMEMCGVEADIQIVLNRFDSKRTPAEIENHFRNESSFSGMLWSGKIPAMKSISRLTSELNDGYQLSGAAENIIKTFVNEVIK